MSDPERSQFKIIVEEEGTRSVVRVDEPLVRVGRALDNEVRLQNTRVSRHHARIELDGDGGWVVDLGSANGLLLNGERTRRAYLRPGDQLELGGARLMLELELPEVELNEASRTQVATQGGVAGRAAAFSHIARSLVSGLPSDEVCRRALDRAIEQVDAERGFLLLSSEFVKGHAMRLDETVDGAPADAALGLKVLAARTFDRNDIALASSRISLGIAQLVLRTGRGILSVDAGNDERFAAMRSVEDLRLRSVMCVPVRFDSQTAGVAYFDNRLQKSAFADAHLDVAQSFADLIAVAVREAKRRQELSDAERELREAKVRMHELTERLNGAGASSSSTSLAPIAPRPSRHDYSAIIGQSEAMEQVFLKLDRIVECELPVLIRGESGTGKELIARAIHQNGSRKARPFISENCAALPDSLLESELFGHTRGAFTGADRAKKGLIEQASGGTLFLDEIGDMSSEMQKKLLRVLQESEVRPLGSDQRISVDIRLVAASHSNLLELVQSGTFREDLYYRINVLDLELPPLRRRRDDIPLLVREFLARAATEMGRPAPFLPTEVLVALRQYDWPGNVRELENEMRRLVVLSNESLRLEQLSPAVLERRKVETLELFAPIEGNLRLAVADFERRAIANALVKHEGNKSRAAAELGISRFALQRKLEKYEEQGNPAGADDFDEAEDQAPSPKPG